MKTYLMLCFMPCCLWGQMQIEPGNLHSSNTSAATPGAMNLSRLHHSIEFDGRIGDGEWDAADTLHMASHWPTFSEKPNTRTQFRVAFDDKYLYFSALCYDKPEAIQGPTFERDVWGMTMDQISIILDTYNDNENGLVFVVTPTGSRIDVSVRNDAQGENPVDQSWNSFWEAHASRHDKGWSAEARIPFTSLRFQPRDGKVTMGLIAYRYVARERQMDIFPDIPPDWGFWSFIKLSKARDILCPANESKRPWFTSPYLLAGAGHHHVQPDGADFPDKIKDTRLAAGLDVQHALTNNMNLDLSFNTDFAQVEADDQVVNLSRFSLFFPEKRRFFLERSSIMDFGFENDNRLFYSRRIGINDGRIVPLWGGVRLVGRLKNYDVGVLTMESREKDGLPSENYSVLRLRRKVSKNNSYIGGILTTQTDWKGADHLAYGLDGIFNLFGNDYLKVNLAGAWNSVDTLVSRHFWEDRKRMYVLWENRAQVGFNYALSYSQVDKNYSPTLGFEARGDFKAIGDRISYGWFTPKSKSLRYMRADLNANAYFSNSTNQLESFLVAPAFYMEWKKNSYIELTFNRFYDKVQNAFELSKKNTIAANEYVNSDISLAFQTPSVHFLNATFNITAGTFYGGKRFSGGITPSYTISKYLTLSGFYQYNYISFAHEPDYVAHVARLKIASSLNVKLSMNAFVQINSLTKVSAINFRLRYNSKDGNDFFFVYNEILNNNGKADPFLPVSDSRALILKFVHTFHVNQ